MSIDDGRAWEDGFRLGGEGLRRLEDIAPTQQTTLGDWFYAHGSDEVLAARRARFDAGLAAGAEAR